MVTLSQLARIALRYDTSMSRAMLRALGVPVPEPAPDLRPHARPDGRYAGMAECFANRGSPMDGPR